MKISKRLDSILLLVITNINTAMKLGRCHSEQGDRQSRFQPVPSFIVPCPRCLPRFTRPNVAQRDVKERHKRENLATSLVRTVNVVQLLACDASKASLACLENVCSRFLNRRHEDVTTVTPVMGTLRNARDD